MSASELRSSVRQAAHCFSAKSPHRIRPAAVRGFTLIELLVVLSILGVLAAITLPAIRSMRKTNAMVSAGRQLVDDLGFARARAISDRTTVHVIFVPPEIANWSVTSTPGREGMRDENLRKRLTAALYTTYALFAERTVGDQPGRPQARYLTSWRTLPDGIFIATNKFVDNPASMTNPDDYTRPFEYTQLPCPTIYGSQRDVPHIAFDAQGRLVDKNNRVRFQNEVLSLGRGSILYSRDPNNLAVDFDLRESPPGNATDPNNFHRVVVDGLTGRARVETPQIQ